jgi:hypothetical protein
LKRIIARNEEAKRNPFGTGAQSENNTRGSDRFTPLCDADPVKQPWRDPRRLLTHMWMPDDDLAASNWVKQNAEALDALCIAVKVDRVCVPLVAHLLRTSGKNTRLSPRIHPMMMYAHIGDVSCLRDRALCLGVRATMVDAARSPAERWADVNACYRLGHLVAQLPTWGAYVRGEEIIEIAFAAHACLLGNGILDGHEEKILDELNTLPPVRRAWERLDIEGRFGGLDTAMLFYRGVSLKEFAVIVDSSVPSYGTQSYYVEWESCLTKFNRYCDQVVRIWKCKSLPELRTQQAHLLDELQAQNVLFCSSNTSIWIAAAAGRFGRKACGEHLLCYLVYCIVSTDLPVEEMKADVFVRLGVLGTKAIADPFSGGSLIFLSRPDFCIISSVGPDGAIRDPNSDNTAGSDDISMTIRGKREKRK